MQFFHASKVLLAAHLPAEKAITDVLGFNRHIQVRYMFNPHHGRSLTGFRGNAPKLTLPTVQPHPSRTNAMRHIVFERALRVQDKRVPFDCHG